MNPFYQQFHDQLFEAFDFEELALKAFRHQAVLNPIYRSYLKHLRVSPECVQSLADIPFLPIEFFRTHQVICEDARSEAVFRSSGTTEQQASRHFVADLDFYNRLSSSLFEQANGPLSDWTLLALLPSYLERSDASLVYMVDNFIRQAGNESGFYLYNHQELVEKIRTLKGRGEKIFLIGVTFALLDLMENFDLDLSGVTLAETGGMKGRRKELVRSELHQKLRAGFGVKEVHSEYGMTELLSQCYSHGHGLFKESKTMRILLREINDPMSRIEQVGKTGGINVIDLGNIHSCCFVETKDLGRFTSEGYFEVLGRFDNSEIRGCNLMV